MSVNILQGDCLETLKTLPDASVQCCVTSPPYYGLRDYGTAKWEGGDVGCDHKIPDVEHGNLIGKSKDKDSQNSHTIRFNREKCYKCGAIRIDSQIGLEETPEAYVAKLVAVFREVKRVLKDDGTLWMNMGDAYWGGKGKSGYELPDEAEERRANGETFQTAHNVPGYLDMRPTDGKHPVIKPKDLIGIPWMVSFALRADGWWLRSDIIWAKPNPMPESVTDRPTKSHEYIFLLSKQARYYYDADAIAEPISSSQKEVDRQYSNGTKDTEWATNKNYSGGVGYNPNGKRNKRDVWTVTTKSYKGAHFATYPPDLIEPCILAGSRPGDTVLDPFNGSGTTGLVAIKHNRNYIGCELNPEYIELTNRRLARVQPFLI